MPIIAYEIHSSNAIWTAVLRAVARDRLDQIYDLADLHISEDGNNVYDIAEKSVEVGARLVAFREIAKKTNVQLYQIDIGDQDENDRFFFVGVENEIVEKLEAL